MIKNTLSGALCPSALFTYSFPEVTGNVNTPLQDHATLLASASMLLYPPRKQILE